MKRIQEAIAGKLREIHRFHAWNSKVGGSRPIVHMVSKAGNLKSRDRLVRTLSAMTLEAGRGKQHQTPS